MQPQVAILHMQAGTDARATDSRMAPMRRPAPSPNRVMVQQHLSDVLTIIDLNWRQVCLRQGCTLVTTYKCTLGLVWGFGTTGEKSGCHRLWGGL